MTVTRPPYSTDTLSSSGYRRFGEASTAPDDTTPLLRPDPVPLPRKSLFERWHSNASAFLGRNAGLLLVVASQFSFALSNISVKWLNNLGEHIPMLEVCDALRTIALGFNELVDLYS